MSPLDNGSTAPARPWMGLVSFAEGDSSMFFGRGAELDDLFRRIRRETVTLLFGQSGLGKTSLLQAGVFPQLRENGFLPVLVRLSYSADDGAPFDQVKALIRQEIASHGLVGPSPSDEQPLWEYLHGRDFELLDEHGEPVTLTLVFDQFEEVFTLGLGRPESRAECQKFLIELADLIENRRPTAVKALIDADPDAVERYAFGKEDYRLVLAMREDYLPHLESVRARAPTLGRNRFRLTPMNGSQALEAVIGPGRALVEDAVAQEIVAFVGTRRTDDPFGLGEDEAAGAAKGLEIEPSLLSLFCQQLNEERIEDGLPRITAELLEIGRAHV